MSGRIQNEYGQIELENQTIATIAGNAAMECYGLVGMAYKSTTDGIFELLKRDQFTKGVKVDVEEDEAVIDLFVILQYGTKISVVANNIIDKVKYSVENMTGITVSKVNVHVQGVRTQK
jgi:uncharacterized alkaline shock family protein YloU